MPSNPFRDGFRIGVTILVAIVSLSTVAGLIITIIITLTAESVAPVHASGNIPYAETAVTTLLLLAPVLLSPWMYYGQGFAASPPQPPRLAYLVAATGLTWFAMGATGVANPWVQYMLGQTQFSGLNVTDHQMTFLAITAGLGEEAAYLATPTGLLFLIGSLSNFWLVHNNRRPISAPRLWLLSAICGPALVVVGRISGHLYQGQASAILGLVWGVALAVIFFWVRSVWPLMLGHIIYDLPVHYDSWIGLISHHVIAPAIISVLGLIWVRRAKHASSNKQAHLDEMDLPN